jgi:hypothetical protein
MDEGPMCCVECFKDEWLRDYARAASEGKGDCDYCDAEGVDLVHIEALYGPFDNMLGRFGVYAARDDGSGDDLIDLIQADYDVFNDELYEGGEADRLLDNIMGSGWDDDSGEPPVRARDLYGRASSRWMTEAWRDFCEKVKVAPEHEPDLPELLDEELGRLEVVVPEGTTLYRARPGFVDEDGQARPLRGGEIGAPPPEKAKPGRANGDGEVVLYATDQEATAVAEVRPSRGLLVSVAEVRAARNLRIVDLSKSPPPSNPFTDEAPQYEEELGALLVAFGDELGRPLRRADDPKDYLPCQKLVRRIRQSGFYDGIRYPSAMAPNGTNIVLFDPTVADIGPSKLVEVVQVGITYEPPRDDDE